MSHKNAIVVLACLLAAPPALSADKADKIRPEDLLARARSEEILWTKGTPPLAMQAQLQVADGKGGWINGEYTFDWESPAEWREEIRFSNYYRLRIGSQEGYWQATNLNYQPELVFELDELLRLKRTLKLEQGERLSKVHIRRRGTVSEECSEAKGKFGTSRALCFDGTAGELLSIDYPSTESGNASDISRVEYSSFKTVDGKSIPFEIQGFRGGEPALVMTIAKIEAMPENEAGLFERPAKSEFWATCDDRTDPEVIHTVVPNFPDPMGSAESVTLYVVIDVDGSPSQIAVIQGGDSELEAATIAAVRHWRYKPAMCGQTPVRTEGEQTFTIHQ